MGGEIVKRRFRGLHQISTIGSTEIVDEYEPLEEGLDKVTDIRLVPFVEIILSKKELDTAHKGYQPPISDSLVTEMDANDLARNRQQGRSKGRSRGKGRGKGRKSSDDEKEKTPLAKRAKAKSEATALKNAQPTGDDKDKPASQKNTKGNRNEARGKKLRRDDNADDKDEHYAPVEPSGSRSLRSSQKSKQRSGSDNSYWGNGGGRGWDLGYAGNWDSWDSWDVSWSSNRGSHGGCGSGGGGGCGGGGGNGSGRWNGPWNWNGGSQLNQRKKRGW